MQVEGQGLDALPRGSPPSLARSCVLARIAFSRAGTFSGAFSGAGAGSGASRDGSHCGSSRSPSRTISPILIVDLHFRVSFFEFRANLTVRCPQLADYRDLGAPTFRAENVFAGALDHADDEGCSSPAPWCLVARRRSRGTRLAWIPATPNTTSPWSHSATRNSAVSHTVNHRDDQRARSPPLNRMLIFEPTAYFQRPTQAQRWPGEGEPRFSAGQPAYYIRNDRSRPL
jgi:hypothetical protein